MMEIARSNFVPIAQRIVSVRWIVFCFRLLALGLAGIYAWAAAISHSMNADGISYLDMGDAFWHGDWATGLSSVWSPLYAWILGGVMRLLAPPMRWEFPVVHLVNFLIFVFALISFEYFWRQVLAHHHTLGAGDEAGHRYLGWPDWALWSIGYLLFISATLVLIEIWSVTPDMLMAAFVFLAAGLLMRLRLGSRSWRTFLCLGLVLGLGYLTKEVMMPVAILFLGIAFYTIGNARAALPRLSLALLGFLLLLLPYFLVLTVAKEGSTFGGAGAFTYAKHVNGIPFAHWQGETPGNGTPDHPTRQIFDEPPIYEFAGPIAGTYPVSYDPSYWNAGLKTNFDLRQQLKALIVSGLFFFDLFFNQYGALFFGILVLYFLGRRPSARPVEILSHWGLVVVALAVFGFYSVILVSGRYIGAFVVVFFADLLANVRLPDSGPARKLIPVISGLIVAFLLVNLAAFSLSGYRDLDAANSGTTTGAKAPTWPGEVAQALLDLGLEEGDPVAIIGYGFDSFWARLAGVRIVAEMPIQEAATFWTAEPEVQTNVIQTFFGSGAKAIVAESVPPYASLPGWRQVGDSNYFIYLLAQNS